MTKYKFLFLLLLLIPIALAYVDIRESNFGVDIVTSTDVTIVGPLEQNGGIPVNIQDQTSPTIDLFFIQPIGAGTTLQQDAGVNNQTINITSTAGFTDGVYVGAFNSEGDRFYFGEQIGVPVGNVITLDTPLDFEFPAGSNVFPFTRDLNVDGSGTTEVFAVRAGGAASTLSIDITRLMITILTDSAVSLAEFGDLPALDWGIVIRKVDGDTRNIFNVKSNGEIANLCYDYTPYLSTNPAQGQDGALFRCTFAGQEKHGVTIRLDPGDRLELLIQDDLSGLDSFRIIAEGHVVTD